MQEDKGRGITMSAPDDAPTDENRMSHPGEVGNTAEASGAMDSEEKVRLMAAVADSVRAEDITVLDLRQLTIITDFFLICTGKSSIQIRAIADRIEERLRDQGVRKLRVEGYQEATWILMDYGDVVAHIMAAEQRAFYNLEAFWSEAPRLPLDLTPETPGLRAAPTRFESLTPPAEAFPEEVEEDTL